MAPWRFGVADLAYSALESATLVLGTDARVKPVKRKDKGVLRFSRGDVEGPDVYPYHPLLSENHIRLLLLEPLAPFSTQNSQPICATLHQVELDSESLSTRPYKALSYEWVVRKEQNEDERDVHEQQDEDERGVHEEQKEVNPTILLDGHTVHIGENLYNALKSIRYLKSGIGGSDLWLWVDALCINQSDVQERGHQVRLMKRIYETAEMVLVWLGMGDGSTNAAMKVFNLETNEFRYRVSREKLDRDELRGIQKICKMGYWRRVWILQEIVLARDYLVVCGVDYVTMEKFERAVTKLCDPKLHINLKRELYKDWLPMSPAYHIITWRDVKGATSPLIGWLKICLSCGFRATDPRDFVYALLGISNDCEGKIEPDYSRSVREVYSSAIALIVNKAARDKTLFCEIFATAMELDWNVGRQVWEEVLCGRKVEEEEKDDEDEDDGEFEHRLENLKATDSMSRKRKLPRSLLFD